MRAEEESVKRARQNQRPIERRYGALLTQLALPPERRAALVQLLIDLREASRDFAAANAATGADASQDREIFDESVFALREGIREKMKTLLGGPGYETYLAAENEVRQRAVVERMQNDLRLSSDQLTEPQASQLLAIVRETNKLRVDDEVLERADAFLSPAQIVALRAQQEQRQLGPQKDGIQKEIHSILPPSK